MLNIAVIGCGRWGPNHLRVFSELDCTRVLACADSNRLKLENTARYFSGIYTTTCYQELLEDERVDAVVIATPTDTHFEIIRAALRAGKHVLAEKPMCVSGREGQSLVQLAEQTGLVLMVGHVFMFNSGIIKLREEIVSGDLGRIQYLDAVRTNLGPIRGDVNALYDLATHDISIFNYLMDASPVAVSALGSCISQKTIEDVCFVTLKYPDGTLGHIHVSWMNPRKVRTVTIVGEKKMAHWDDVSAFDALRLYDKRIEDSPRFNSFGEFQYSLRSGDVHMPAVQRSEPLLSQARAFARWVGKGTACRWCTAQDGLAIVQVLEAATSSMRQGGALCPVLAEEPEAVEQFATV